jgi:hypothetical protein
MWQEVAEYGLMYQNGPVVWVTLIGGTKHRIAPDSNDAVFVADMLRNEKPIFYDPDVNVLSTSSNERVGEEEKT